MVYRNLYHEAKPSCISCIYHEAKPSCICEVYHVAELYNLITPRRKIVAEKMISEQNKSSFYIRESSKIYVICENVYEGVISFPLIITPS